MEVCIPEALGTNELATRLSLITMEKQLAICRHFLYNSDIEWN